jgi:formate dehydrogenase subunit delta
MSATGSSVVRMANQIARNFAVQGDEAAVRATAEHIDKYWDPRMKAAAADLLAEPDSGFSVIAREALRHIDAG